MAKTLDKKQEFAQRLQQALKRSPKLVKTGTQLALQFNLKYEGNPITVQAAQKWLAGEAVPTEDKMETLAEWLNVSPQWLRHGIPDDRPQSAAGKKGAKGKAAVVQPTEEEFKLLTRLRSMPEHRRYLVNEIIEQFSLEQEMWRE